jgi:hypothetical protein
MILHIQRHTNIVSPMTVPKYPRNRALLDEISPTGLPVVKASMEITV